MMKRIIFYISILLLLLSPVFAAEINFGETHSSTLALPLQLNTKDFQSFSVGFSNGYLTSATGTVGALSDTEFSNTFTVGTDEFITEDTLPKVTFYIWWKIISTSKVKVQLKINPLVSGDSTIDLTVSKNGNDYGKCDLDLNGSETISTEKTYTVLDYAPATNSNEEGGGLQWGSTSLVLAVDRNANNFKATSYTSTVVLEIVDGGN
ncbi:MAG TPA: hypothetical protein IAB12_00970 [Candidatus Ornithospirochaeta avicola]|uniref:Cohesin domain-containing protein n=1 Tax=Candidatus Ornithospirochaeta avicola TaxID=2840896 RepID=A0A9D1PTI3_9SPIO|nr:hypothetical protein [Candidatus Ornithospirochaeta avicola]